MKKIAVVFVHGMGKSKKDFASPIIEKLSEHMGEEFNDILFKQVNYSTKIQKNQDAFIGRLGDMGGRLMMKFRRFFISSLGDNVAIKYQKILYKYVMTQIDNAYYSAIDQIEPDAPIILYAHSLGTQVISSWIFDKQKQNADLSRVKFLITTGSPIPAFIVGLNQHEIYPIEDTCSEFKWINFYNHRDPIGLKLEPINVRYALQVKDIKVNKGFPFFGHDTYWTDKRVYRRLAQEIKRLIE